MSTITLTILKCLHCAHKWVPRHTKRPGVCPVCKRKDWDRARRKTGA